MSCGHDGCACSPSNQTPEQHAKGEHLPTVGEHPRDQADCCGGHGHRHQHDPEPRAGQPPVRT